MALDFNNFNDAWMSIRYGYNQDPSGNKSKKSNPNPSFDAVDFPEPSPDHPRSDFPPFSSNPFPIDPSFTRTSRVEFSSAAPTNTAIAEDVKRTQDKYMQDAKKLNRDLDEFLKNYNTKSGKDKQEMYYSDGFMQLKEKFLLLLKSRYLFKNHSDESGFEDEINSFQTKYPTSPPY